MPQDFTKKHPPLRPPLRSGPSPQPTNTPAIDYSRQMQQYIRDLNLDGKVLVPGKDKPEEMVGIDPALFKQRHQENERRKEELLRAIAATWRCTKCGREWPGRDVRVRVRGGLWQTVDGVRTLVGGKEVPVCVDQQCDSPVVMVKDPYRSKWV